MKTADIKIGKKYAVASSHLYGGNAREALVTATGAPIQSGASTKNYGIEITYHPYPSEPNYRVVEVVRPQDVIGSWEDYCYQCELERQHEADERAAKQAAHKARQQAKSQRNLAMAAELRKRGYTHGTTSGQFELHTYTDGYTSIQVSNSIIADLLGIKTEELKAELVEQVAA